jgi:hypothetical protein
MNRGQPKIKNIGDGYENKWTSFLRKQESGFFFGFWIPVFTGMTKRELHL